jgi:hypothetical protein
MLPVFELASAHKEIAAVDAAQPYIIAAYPKLALGKAHRRRTIAAPATLVKHERAVLVAEQVNGGFGSLGNEDARSGHKKTIEEQCFKRTVMLIWRPLASYHTGLFQT